MLTKYDMEVLMFCVSIAGRAERKWKARVLVKFWIACVDGGCMSGHAAHVKFGEIVDHPR